MNSISKNVYIDKLHDIVTEYNTDVKDYTYINFEKEIDNKDPKFKVGDHVRISKYNNIFAKGYMLNWSEKIFIIKKIKSTMQWTYVISYFNGEENIGT